MKLIGNVSIDDVLAALPADRATRSEARKHAGWCEWAFDRGEIGLIGAQDPATHRLDRVQVLYDDRVLWMTSANGIRSLKTHRHFLEQLAKGHDFGRPVLISDSTNGKDRQIHDGAHRIYAAYEFSTSLPEFRLRVFWNQGLE
jgi:hypothetical protein